MHSQHHIFDITNSRMWDIEILFIMNKDIVDWNMNKIIKL